MTAIVSRFSHIWGAKPSKLLAEYTYQTDLTAKLDRLQPEELTREVLYEIVLWKLNRFPRVQLDLLIKLKSVAKLKPKQHRKASQQLRALLTCSGIALPMASTILRFLNPNVFQIIDDRVYRIVHPGKAKYPTKPFEMNETFLKASERIYFAYLDELHKNCCKQLPFKDVDRILYQLDIKLGNKIGGRVKSSVKPLATAKPAATRPRRSTQPTRSGR